MYLGFKRNVISRFIIAVLHLWDGGYKSGLKAKAASIVAHRQVDRAEAMSKNSNLSYDEVCRLARKTRNALDRFTDIILFGDYK